MPKLKLLPSREIFTCLYWMKPLGYSFGGISLSFSTHAELKQHKQVTELKIQYLFYSKMKLAQDTTCWASDQYCKPSSAPLGLSVLNSELPELWTPRVEQNRAAILKRLTIWILTA